MPSREDAYGTGHMGDWERVQDNTFRWHSQADDPYLGVTHTLPLPSLDRNFGARKYVEHMREEHGVDYEFMFDGVKMTWGSRLAKWEKMEKCQRDPDYIVEYFKKNYYKDILWDKMIAGAHMEQDTKLAMCINPNCHRVYFRPEGEEYRSLSRCEHCRETTMVSEELLLEGKVPDGAIQNLMAHNAHQLDRRININNTLINIASTHDKANIRSLSGQPFLYISNSIPQLKIGGDHFIRGRVNREVLSESGVHVNPDRLVINLCRTNTDMMMLLERLFSDENIILDEGKADKFRQEYIDGQWDDEFVLFVNELRENGTLKVDSSGVHDTLTALYNMSQRASGKKTIIKKTGKIIFPTQEVLENISQPLIEKAFSVTEHGSYTDFSEVFQVDEGAAG